MGRISEALKRFEGTSVLSRSGRPGDVVLEPRAVPTLEAFRQEHAPASGEARTPPSGSENAKPKRRRFRQKTAARAMPLAVAADSGPKAAVPALIEAVPVAKVAAPVLVETIASPKVTAPARVSSPLIPLERPVVIDRPAPETHLLDYFRVIQRRP